MAKKAKITKVGGADITRPLTPRSPSSPEGATPKKKSRAQLRVEVKELKEKLRLLEGERDPSSPSYSPTSLNISDVDPAGATDTPEGPRQPVQAQETPDNPIVQPTEVDTRELANCAWKGVNLEAAKATKLGKKVEGIDSRVLALELHTRLEANKGKTNDSLKFSSVRTKGKSGFETWVKLFERWAKVKRLSDDNLVAYAELNLEKEALDTWFALFARLQAEGKNPEDFPIFKKAMYEKYVEIAPELTVRSELDALRQTSSVQVYYDSFRTIAARAVDSPVIGAEAIHFFVKGLKQRIKVMVAIDPETKVAYRDFDKLVQHAIHGDAMTFASGGAENAAYAADLDSPSPPYLRAVKKGKGRKPKAAHQPVREDRREDRQDRQDRSKKARTALTSPPGRAAKFDPAVLAADVRESRMARRVYLKCGGSNHRYSDCTGELKLKD